MPERFEKILIKARNWEYWSSNIIYFPILPYLLFLFVRVRNCFFFNAANPGIEYGGFVMESKWKIHEKAPPGFFPHTIPVRLGDNIEHVISTVSSQFRFPVVAKPDIGSKGRGVMVINNSAELRLYHASCPTDYLIQEKVNYPCEAGIFYVRYPNSPKGMLTGIVEKRFIEVTGDGVSTLRQLLLQNKRYILQMEVLNKIVTAEEMMVVLPAGKSHIVLEIGNHARGAMFLDASHRINEELTEVIDKVCKKFKGFYFGRLDIRFESWDSLQRGLNYSIIELNGSGSEPTFIYDPSHSIFYAWREICRHWEYMFRVSRQNHAMGIAYLTAKDAIRIFWDNARINKLLESFQPVRVRDN